ncbi:MAG: hypothetical protein ACJ749_13035 [Flavisolibacter sp.]
MKLLFLVAIASSLFSFNNGAFIGRKILSNDTTINHSLDGKINEWPAQKFEADAATQLKYAVDNDKQNLYLVLSISNSREQMRIMREGMVLYIDTKGKKKESHGIEFPVKRDQANDIIMNFKNDANGNINEQSPEQKKAMMKAMRAEMALNLTSIKVFGFSEDKSEEQGLIMPGSANVAFGWDSTDAMNIEYRIPLSFLENSSSADQKEISVGWKLNGFQMSSHNSSSEYSGGGRHGGGGYGSGGGHRGNGGGGYGNHEGNSNNQQNFESMLKDQIFWTKYILKE